MAIDDKPAAAEITSAVAHGNGSVAHQIIGQFLAVLGAEPGYGEIAHALKSALLESKLTEASIRIALFGEDAL